MGRCGHIFSVKKVHIENDYPGLPSPPGAYGVKETLARSRQSVVIKNTIDCQAGVGEGFFMWFFCAKTRAQKNHVR